jgi:hypothetical protein
VGVVGAQDGLRHRPLACRHLPHPLGAYRHDADGFRLTADSPAIDAGQELAACEALTGGVDIDGEPREGRCDAGPEEFVHERSGARKPAARPGDHPWRVRVWNAGVAP